jgi:YHS domain-containing protein
MARICIIIFSVFFFIEAEAQQAEIFSTSDGAIRGYDPVAYFTVGQAVKGDSKFTATYKGVKWYFSSEENLKTFKTDPEKYAPQYGGYCAYAVSQNYTYETNPNAFTIVDDKLYLNYDKKTSKAWNAKRGELIKKANENWPEVLKKK